MSAPQSNRSWHPKGFALIGMYVGLRRIDERDGTTIFGNAASESRIASDCSWPRLCKNAN
jgi:hypothetical protein